MELLWEEAADSKVEEVVVLGSGSRWVVWVQKGSVYWWVIRGGSLTWWWAAHVDCGLEGVLMGVRACGVREKGDDGEAQDML